MDTIIKVELFKSAGYQAFPIPEGSVFLSAHNEGEKLVAYFLGDTFKPYCTKGLTLIYTGNVVNQSALTYLTSVKFQMGDTLHLFKQREW